MSNNDNDQWPDDPTDLPAGSTDAGDAGRPAGDDLRDTIDGIGQDTDEILDILRDGRSTPAPRPTPTGQPRPRRSRNAVIDELVDDITSQVTRDLADAMPPPEAPTDEAPDSQMPSRQRDARGRWTPNQPPVPDTPTTDPAGEPDPESSDTATADNDPERRTRRRDSRGRWVRDDPPTTDISSRNQDGDPSADTDQLGRDGESPAYWDRLAGAVGQGMQDATQGVDPTIEALREAGVFKAVSWVFGSKKDKIPKEQGKHNRVVERLLKKLVGHSEDSSRSGGMGMMLVRLAPFLVFAVAAGLAAIAPVVAAALGAALVAWLAVNAVEIMNNYFDANRPPEQGDTNPDGSINKGIIGAGNRFAKGVMNSVRGSANSVNAWFGGDNDYFDDGTAPDSMNRIGLKTDAVNQQGGTAAAGDYQAMTYLAFRKEGLSRNQAIAMTAEVGRENDFNPKAMFGTHTDLANNSQNLGIFSWQGERKTRLVRSLRDQGLIGSDGKIVQGQQSIDAMARFAVGEIKNDPAYAQTKHQFLANPNIDPEAAAPILGKNYVRWAYGQTRLKSGAAFDSAKHDQKRRSYKNSTARKAQQLEAQPAATVTPDPIQNQPTQQAPVTLPMSPKALAEHAEQQPTPAPTVNLGSNSTTKVIAPSMPYLPIRAPAIKLPAQPAVAQRLNTPAPPAPTSSSDDSMTQNVSDRQLAHLITGGLGMGGQVG